MQVVWHGTVEEAMALEQALRNNCGCKFDPSSGARTATCPGHQALLDDQRWADGLLYARHIATRLQCEEFMLPEPRE